MASRPSRLDRLTRFLSALSAVALSAMMVLTCADVVLRLMRRPVTGTYELMGFLSALFVSFALARTTMDRGHIAVDFLVMRLSRKTQCIIEAVNDAVCTVMFALITSQCMVYGFELRAGGEVSMTLQLPIYPVVYGIGTGCAVLCLVLAVRVLDDVQEARTGA